MRMGSVVNRLKNLGSDKWAVHHEAMKRKAAGQDILVTSIGEPTIPADPHLVETCIQALQDGRTGYSNGQGEANLLAALADRYAKRSGHPVTSKNVMCFPGTQTSLYAVMTALLDPGDEVLVGDPYYVTYEGIVASAGAHFKTVPLRPENGFRMQADDLQRAITSKTKLVLLNSPHNPTGAVLTKEEIADLGAVCREHDLWIISDEVYEDLVFEGAFHSPFDNPDLADRTIVVSSISKSHAAPGLRSGWAVGPETFIADALPLSETILFGNQPFIADATASALRQENTTGATLCADFKRRAKFIEESLELDPILSTEMPKAGMFAMINVRATGLSGEEFAWKLLNEQNASVMPGEAFGEQAAGFIRVSLTIPDADIEALCHRLKAISLRRAS